MVTTTNGPLYFCGSRPAELGRASRQPGSMRWRKRELTWCLVNRLPQLTLEKQIADTIWAFDQYRIATRGWFSYRQVMDAAQADIILTTFRDRPNGVLADMQLPPGDDRQLQGRFDSAEQWNATVASVQYRLTAMHEFGHAHGMSHIDDKRAASVLDSMYNPQLLTLQELDIAYLERIYPEVLGLPKIIPGQPTPTPTTPSPTPTVPPVAGEFEGPIQIIFPSGAIYQADNIKRIN